MANGTAEPIGVVVPYYDGQRFLGPLLRSLGAQGVAQHVVLVDNSPIASAAGHPPVDGVRLEVVRTQPTIGFGRACNVGIRALLRAGIAHAVILNQDTVVRVGALAALVGVVRDDRADVVSPLELSPDGSDVVELFVASYLAQSGKLVGDLVAGLPLDPCYPISRLPGFCLAARVDLFRELGPFDPLFQMYGEDVDLAARLRARGARQALVPAARIEHWHSNARVTGSDRAKIRRWQARSRSIRLLKDPGRGLPAALVRDLAQRVPLYGRLLLAEPRNLARYVEDQLATYAHLPQIVRARRDGDVGRRADAVAAGDLAADAR